MRNRGIFLVVLFVLVVIFVVAMVKTSCAGTGRTDVTIGNGPLGVEARVPIYITFPNTNSGEERVAFWQLVFDLGGAQYVGFEFPPGGVPGIVNETPPCGGILVQSPFPCILQGVVGWLHVQSSVPVQLSLVPLESCNGQWYSQVVSADSACLGGAFYPYSAFNVTPGGLDATSDVALYGDTWTVVKELYR